MSDNAYKCSPRQAREYINDVIFAGLVPFVQSSPGMGKSSIMRDIAEANSLVLIDHRLSTSAPEDMSGLPRFDENGHARFAPFADLFPLDQGSEAANKAALPEGKQGWMLFLDEFNSAKKEVQAAAYKLILDRMVGQHKLHPNVVITAAGNLATDRAIVNPISTAMQSRVIHLEMELNHKDWMEDVAIAQNYDSRIIAFLSQYPTKLMDFKPTHQDKTFACPRTWEFMNKLMKSGVPVTKEKVHVFAGTITSAMAVEFIQYVKVFHNLPTVEQIVADPFNVPVPDDLSTRWALIASMMEKISNNNFEALTHYIGRFDAPFKVLFFRFTMVRHPDMRRHPAFAKAAVELSRYLLE